MSIFQHFSELRLNGDYDYDLCPVEETSAYGMHNKQGAWPSLWGGSMKPAASKQIVAEGKNQHYHQASRGWYSAAAAKGYSARQMQMGGGEREEQSWQRPQYTNQHTHAHTHTQYAIKWHCLSAVRCGAALSLGWSWLRPGEIGWLDNAQHSHVACCILMKWRCQAALPAQVRAALINFSILRILAGKNLHMTRKGSPTPYSINAYMCVCVCVSC